MSINFGEVALSMLICSILTILIYIASWFKHDENDEEKLSEKELSSNAQTLDNVESIARSAPTATFEYPPQDLTICSKEDLCVNVTPEISGKSQLEQENQQIFTDKTESDSNVEVTNELKVSETIATTDSGATLPDDVKTGRLHLSLQYKCEQNLLSVQILDTKNVIQNDEKNSSEGHITFSLIGLNTSDDEEEKHTRFIAKDSSIDWNKPVLFNVPFENAIAQNLFISVSDSSRDREISIPLNDLDSQGGETNRWFDLQYAQISY